MHYHSCPHQKDWISCRWTSRVTLICFVMMKVTLSKICNEVRIQTECIPSWSLSMTSNIGHGITSSDRMVWYNVCQILLGSGKCLANCMNTYSLAGFQPQLYACHFVKMETSNARTSVSVYFDSWALNRLFLTETSGHNDDLVIPCTVSVSFPFDIVLPTAVYLSNVMSLLSKCCSL